jgi:hypothetical protein
MEFVAEENHETRFNEGLEICLAVDCPVVNVEGAKVGNTQQMVETGAVMRGLVVEVYYKSQI